MSKWKGFFHEMTVGYGVPSECDHPDCETEIDRGLSYVCGGQPYGGEAGCGLYFCEKHLRHSDAGLVCERCAEGGDLFEPKPDAIQWVKWKLYDGSWMRWRLENPEEEASLYARLGIPSPQTCPSRRGA